MTPPDPRWLEILKASGWQLAAVAIACGVLLWANHEGWLPLDLWMTQLLAVAMTVCGLLALATIASFVSKSLPKWLAAHEERSALASAVDTLNADETTFLKSQVEKNQTTAQLTPFTGIDAHRLNSKE